ncbi:unnamed protein product [Coccothraustes coccothraustes]
MMRFGPQRGWERGTPQPWPVLGEAEGLRRGASAPQGPGPLRPERGHHSFPLPPQPLWETPRTRRTTPLGGGDKVSTPAADRTTARHGGGPEKSFPQDFAYEESSLASSLISVYN